MVDDSLKSRVLVKDGVWLVPPEQRPTGWQQVPVQEHVKQQDTPSVEPQMACELCGRPIEKDRIARAGTAQGTPQTCIFCSIQHIAIRQAENSRRTEARKKEREAMKVIRDNRLQKNNER